MKFRFEVTNKKETIELEDLKKQYQDVYSEKTLTMQIIDGVQLDILKISKEVLTMVETIRECINRLN